VLALLAGVWFFLVDTDSGGREAGGSTTTPTTTASDVDVYGVETSTDDCPAAGVPDGQAVCTDRAECWSGMFVVSGVVESIRTLPCEQGHAFETFAVALVPGDVPDPYLDVLEAHPTVRQVCSMENLLASRFGEARRVPAEGWEVSVLSPTPEDREQGRSNVYRCLGTLTAPDDMVGVVFRPDGQK
jgi:hypothetical protein